MTMKPCLGAIALLMGVASCEKSAPDFGKQVGYTFTSKYVPQRSMGPTPTDSCFRDVKIDGSIMFKVNDVGVTFVDATGRLDLTQSRPPLDSNRPCDGVFGIPLSFSTGTVEANVTGAPDDFTFAIEKTDTTSSGTIYTRRYTYAGTVNADGGVGILTYELVGSGTMTTTNTIRVGIALTPFVPQKTDRPGAG